MITRWCRAVRRPIPQDLENPTRGNNMLMTNLRVKGQHTIPFLELANICPILMYDKATMTNSTCAVCLDDFKDDFYVRVLPCHHGYCTACIGMFRLFKKNVKPENIDITLFY
jgi:hypothetical protein